MQTTIRALVGLSLISAANIVWACPFCASVSQTFTEEIQAMDAVVVAKLVQPPPKETGDENAVPKGVFEITQIIRGAAVITDVKQKIEAVYFGRDKVGSKFLLMAVDPPKLQWSTPLPLTKQAEVYVAKIVTLPEKGPDRLRFFLTHLENKDEMLARDAYDEFAKAPYADVKAIKGDMDHAQLIDWIQDPNIPASRRRLYFTMLGVCGQKEDLKLLESMLQSDDRKMKAGLDSMIACYITLKGEAGLPLIEDQFLKNKKAEYADTYAAIMALRFHGGEDVVEQTRVLQSLHNMLERPQLADLVIPDLARWEDWSQIDKLVELFKNADEKSSWVKVPVINYLRACPKPEAKAKLLELEKLDPAAVKRANTFFPLTPAKKTPKKTESSEVVPANPMNPEIEPVQTIPVAVVNPTVDENALAAAEPAFLDEGVATTSIPATTGVEVAYPGSPVLAQSTPNQWLIAAVSLAIGTLMLWFMWSILAGAGQRSPY